MSETLAVQTGERPVVALPQGFVDVVGRGRMGQALFAGLSAAGIAARGPLGRGADGAGARIVLLCVPDREIANAASVVVEGPLIGHVSASAPLTLLGERERFGLHPLMSVVGRGARFGGAVCAIQGSTSHAAAVARALAVHLGMLPREISTRDRALYHAAASAASNYLVTVEAMAERLAGRVGLDRAALVPLVRGTVDNWEQMGTGALTGPIVRGDEETIARQRTAVGEAAPDLLPFWDALVTATRALSVERGTS